MQVNKTTVGTTLLIELVGRLDTASAAGVQAEIEALLNDDVKELVIDCERMDYLASSGLRILLQLHKRMMDHGKMTIINVNEYVKEIFDMTGFSDVLNIEK